ncbi:MAG TPA: SelB C-terminal domain-containing protein, partial [Longimicrobiales bacterium]|nr:SelB C-terminal domain-containing protein [Longimicrobiales bacterium]
GLSRARAPIVTGLIPSVSARILDDAVEGGALPVGDAVVSPAVATAGADALVRAVDAFHDGHPLRPGMPLEATRSVLPDHAHPDLADALLERLSADGAVTVVRGSVRRAGFEPTVDDRQERIRDRLLEVYREAGLAPPAVDELPPELRDDPDLWPLLKLLVDEGALTAVSDEYFVPTDEIEEAAARVRDRLGGRTDLGPADFREALPVTRKHLMPLLAHLDRVGVTVRRESGREVGPA